MNAITRWDPVKEMEEMHNRLSNLFGRTPARLGEGKEESIAVAEWAPLVAFRDGVLKVHLAKSEQTKPKQIEVKVA
jgi:HSP20 family protein